jgi:hypothetical protein
MIRSLHVKGHPQQIQTQVEDLKKMIIDETSWELSDKGDCLFFNPACWPLLDLKKFSLFIRYHDTAIRPSISYRNMFKEIRLNEKKKVVIERWPVCDEIELDRDDILRFGREYLNTTLAVSAGAASNKPQLWNEIEMFEIIRQGLSAYC